jgi:hypothetical protein
MVPLSSGAVFAAAVMAGVTYMALPVACFVCMEVIEWLLPTHWHRSGITVMRVVAVVHVAIKAVRTVKPGAGTDEQTTTEPIRPIVSVGSTIIRSVVIVPVGTYRLNSDIDTDLSLCSKSPCQQNDSSSRS